MAKPRRKKPHTCKNHPQRPARGRCIVCKRWVCHSCAVLLAGQFHCKDTCAASADQRRQPEKTDTGIKKIKPDVAGGKIVLPANHPQENKHENERRHTTFLWKSIVFWAGLTFGSAGIVFGLYEMRNNFEIARQLQIYKESRQKLITLLKKRTIQLEQLRDSLAPDSSAFISKHVPGKKERVPPLIEQKEYVYDPQTLPVTFDNGSSDKKLVSLTFDADAHVNVAEEILDTLASRRVSATMFLTAGFIRKHPDLVLRIIAQGHEIGNHTTTHPHLTTWEITHSQETLPEVTPAMLADELSKANDIFNKLTGTDMLPIWRAPYGEKNSEICRWAREAGYLHIGWKQASRWWHNFDTNDWIPDSKTPGYYTPRQTLEKFSNLADAQPYGLNGAIILMHLGTVRKVKDEQIHRVLGLLIDQIRAKGYEIVPVSGLLRESGVDILLLKGLGSEL